LKYFIGAALIALAAWFGLKNPIYNMALTRGDIHTPPQPDYTLAAGWADQPAQTPPGAWETPWGVDIFLVYPAPRLNAPHGRIDADEALVHPSHAKLAAEIRAALPADAVVYVPKVRPVSAATSSQTGPTNAADDVIAAFDAYLGNTNRERAIMLVAIGSANASIAPLLVRLSEDELRDRFAGFVHFSTDDDANTEGLYPDLKCSPSLGGACFQSVLLDSKRPITDHLLPRLPNMRAEYSVLDPEGTAAAVAVQQETVSSWLDANAPKPAEPLFGFEAIEAAPIYRPNGEAIGAADPEN
jgi:hypothetical protein